MNKLITVAALCFLSTTAFAETEVPKPNAPNPQFESEAAQAQAVVDRANQGQNWSNFIAYTNNPETGYQTATSFNANVMVVEDVKYGTQYLVFRLPNGQFNTVERTMASTDCYSRVGFLCQPAIGQTNTRLEQRRAVEREQWRLFINQLFDKFKGLFGN